MESSVFLTIKQAAELTNRSKSAIAKAIKNGRISANKDANGVYRIHAAELQRVYTVSGEKVSDNSSGVHTDTAVYLAEIDGLKRMVGQLENQRDDLQKRLDAEGVERRKIFALLVHAQKRKKRFFWF